MSGASFLPLTPTVVAEHLRGQQHIGLHPLTEQETCWWAAAAARQLGTGLIHEAMGHVTWLSCQRWPSEVR